MRKGERQVGKEEGKEVREMSSSGVIVIGKGGTREIRDGLFISKNHPLIAYTIVDPELDRARVCRDVGVYWRDEPAIIIDIVRIITAKRNDEQQRRDLIYAQLRRARDAYRAEFHHRYRFCIVDGEIVIASAAQRLNYVACARKLSVEKLFNCVIYRRIITVACRTRSCSLSREKEGETHTHTNTHI